MQNFDLRPPCHSFAILIGNALRKKPFARGPGQKQVHLLRMDPMWNAQRSKGSALNN